MAPRTRRSYLVALGAAGLAGCASDGPGTQMNGAPTTPTRTGTTLSPSHTPTATGEQLRLRVVDPSTVDGQLTVYPTTLRRWLRDAARTGDTLRVHAEVPVYAPEPLLPTFESVRLQTPNGEVDGTYVVTAEGGPRYSLLVGAEAVDEVPENEMITPVGELAPERREFAGQAVERNARVYPETELGEWVRHEFFGGYFEFDGTTYRGREVQQTDAAFFSREVWYVLALSPVPEHEASNLLTLRLPEIESAVRRVVDPLFEGYRTVEPRTPVANDLPEAVVRFAGKTDYLLTHTSAFAVEISPRNE